MGPIYHSEAFRGLLKSYFEKEGYTFQSSMKVLGILLMSNVIGGVFGVLATFGLLYLANWIVK